LFTAIFMTRLIFEYMLSKDMKITLSFPCSFHTLKNANFQFIKKRKVAYLISLIAVIISFAANMVKAFDYGVDFQGSHTYNVRYYQNVALENIRENLYNVLSTTTEVKTFGSENQLRITTS